MSKKCGEHRQKVLKPTPDIAEATNDVFGFAGYSENDTAHIASENALALLPRIARQFGVR